MVCRTELKSLKSKIVNSLVLVAAKKVVVRQVKMTASEGRVRLSCS